MTETSKPQQDPRISMLEDFRDINGNSLTNDYDANGGHSWGIEWYGKNEGKELPHIRIMSHTHIPSDCEVVTVDFDYTKYLYKFTIQVDMILSKKETKKIRNTRIFKNKQYEIYRWFMVNTVAFIKEQSEVTTIDLYKKIKDDVNSLNT